MTNRRDFLKSTGAAVLGTAMPAFAFGHDKLEIHSRPIPVTGEELPMVGLGNSRVFQEGDLEATRELIELFLSEAPGRVRGLAAGLEAGDFDEVFALAHALKGASANLWANSLRDLLAELEAAARRSDLESARGLMARVEEEYGAVERFLGEVKLPA